MLEPRRQRILLVTRNLPPLLGGMERLNWHMAEELAKIAEVRVVGPAGSTAPTSIEVREALGKPLWMFLWCARALARREARAWHPDVVLAGSGLTAPIARSAARTCGAKAAVYVHGLDVAVKHPAYRAVWIPALRQMDCVIANSRATVGLCRDIGIDPARIGIVHPGVDMPRNFHERCVIGPSCDCSRDRSGESHPGDSDIAHSERGQSSNMPGALESHSVISDTVAGAEVDSSPTSAADAIGIMFRQRHFLASRPLLLSVGRLSSRKGLCEFVAQSLPRIVAVHPDAMLLIVGDAPKDALYARAQTPEKIRAVAKQVGVADNVRFLGTITDYQELGAVYRAANVHVFPVREIPGDPEGFGMVAVEAAAHGLPTVAFATGGVVDAVAEGQSGHLVPSGDYAAFTDAVLRVLAMRGALGASCVSFAQRFAWPGFGREIAAQLRMLRRGSRRAVLAQSRE